VPNRCTQARWELQALTTIFGYKHLPDTREPTKRQPRLRVVTEKSTHSLTVFKINSGRRASQALPLPSHVDRKGVAGIGVNRKRTTTALQRVVALSSVFLRLNSREPAAKVRELTGQSETEHGRRQTSYDLKKRRSRRLLERVGESWPYAATELGPPLKSGSYFETLKLPP
jgi:hypothetical protein